MDPKIKTCSSYTIKAFACEILAGSGGFRDSVMVFTNSCKKSKKQHFCAFFGWFLNFFERPGKLGAAEGPINQKLLSGYIKRILKNLIEIFEDKSWVCYGFEEFPQKKVCFGIGYVSGPGNLYM